MNSGIVPAEVVQRDAELRSCLAIAGSSLARAAELHVDAVLAEDWKVFGFGSIEEWREDLFGHGQVKLTTGMRREIVLALTEADHSTRQIAAATGASQGTVVNDQHDFERKSEQDYSPPSDQPERHESSHSKPKPPTPKPSAERSRNYRDRQRSKVIPPPSPPPEPAHPTPQPAPEDEEEKVMEKARQIRITEQGILEGKTQKTIAKEIGFSRSDDKAFTKVYTMAKVGLKQDGYDIPDGGTPERLRELRKQKKKGDYLELVQFQMRIAEMCEILRDSRIQDYGLSEVEMWKMLDIHDDLTSLAEWLDRTLSAVQGYLGDREVRQKIEKLRDTNGRTPEEAETARKLADRLARKLETRLSA